MCTKLKLLLPPKSDSHNSTQTAIKHDTLTPIKKQKIGIAIGMGFVNCFLCYYCKCQGMKVHCEMITFGFLRSCNENHLLSGSYHLIGLSEAPLLVYYNVSGPRYYPGFLPFVLHLLGNLCLLGLESSQGNTVF